MGGRVEEKEDEENLSEEDLVELEDRIQESLAADEDSDLPNNFEGDFDER